jgi:tetratricopeptide (TPR) repeat protein
VVIASIVLAARAEARPARAPDVPPAPAERADFWREMLEPHSDEVRRIVTLADQYMRQGDIALFGDYDATGTQRMQFYRTAYGMLRYAHRRAPENLEVLRLLGQTADEIGKTHEAIEALEAAVRLAGADKAGIEVTGRLGAIYLRLGRVDDAIRYLRLAQGPILPGKAVSATTLVHLSNALAARGEMGEAIDVLANALPTQVPWYANEVTLVSFALAVQYDRDEQRGEAFEALDHMQTTLTSGMGATVQNALGVMRFAPAEDQHYYQGLLYEAMGNYTEARAEWALYAAADMPYRTRALEHIAAIDMQRRAPKPVEPSHVHVRRHP